MLKAFKVEDYEFVDAIDYQDFESLEELKAWARLQGDAVDKCPFVNLIPACLSQMKLLEIISQQDDYCIGMEDDFDFVSPNGSINAIISEFKGIELLKPDLVQLGSWNRPWHGERVKSMHGSRLHKAFSHDNNRSWANIYKPEYAAKLLDAIRKEFLPIDTILAEIDLPTENYFMYPYMCIENEMCLDSDLDDANIKNYYFRKRFLSSVDKKGKPRKQGKSA